MSSFYKKNVTVDVHLSHLEVHYCRIRILSVASQVKRLVFCGKSLRQANIGAQHI